MEKHKVDRQRWHKRKDEYDDKKAKIFMIMRGQGTLAMKNKLDQTDTYKTLEDNTDVVEFKKLLRELVFGTSENARYEYWAMMIELKEVLAVGMYSRESLAGYHRRWDAAKNVVEGRWGAIRPSTIPTGDNETTASKKFWACVFLDGTDDGRYGKVKKELSNSYIAGQKNYPGTVEDMMTMLSNRDDIKVKEADRGGIVTSFSGNQIKKKSKEKRRCHKCGKKGHLIRKCPLWDNESSDDESSQGSGVPKGTSSFGIGWAD